MQRLEIKKRIALYIMLFSCIISLLGLGLSDSASVSLINSTNNISNPIANTIDNISSVYVPEYDFAFVIVKGIKNYTNKSVSGFNALLNIIGLIILINLLYYISRQISSFQRIFINYKYYLVDYIHAKDGRKRQILLSMIFE